MKKPLDRRDFLKTAALAGAGLGVSGLASATDEKPAAAGTPKPALAAKVPRKTLGTTGEDVPILLMGCAQRFDDRYDKLLHRGFKEGVDYLDTALVYAEGWSQKTIAPFLQQVGRDKVWITTKAPTHRNSATAETFQADLDTCLKDLGTDHVDLFFMHALDDAKYVTRPYAQMGEKLKKQGKIRHFGFSCHDGNVVELLNQATKVGGIDAIMFRYNFAKYGDKELNLAIDACKKAGIGLIAMKTQRSVPQDAEHVKAFQSEDFTLGQAKLKSVWADERIDTVVSHMDNLEVLEENIAAAKSPVQLSMNEFQQLQRIAARTAHHACDGCKHVCESRITGETKVADSLRFLMYDECYGETEKARAFYRALTPAQRAVEGVDFAAAAEACPQGIDIAARLRQAQEQLA